MGFFVDRPVFATVIAIIITLVGALAATGLPVEQYPNVAPPQIKVEATFPGASPETIENTVAAQIEREMNGINGLLYMESNSNANGTMQLYLSFQPGTDLDIAQADVNNRVKRVEPLLPQEVLRLGLKVDKTNPQILQLVIMKSSDPRFDNRYVANLAYTVVVNELKRLPGAGDVTLFNAAYAMRLWVDPDLLAKYRMTISDISKVIQEQNANYAVGEIGQAPSQQGQLLNFPVLTQGTFTEEEQFRNVIVKALPDGSVVRVRDVARVELNAEDYTFDIRHNKEPAVAVAIYLRSGGNALALADAVRKKMTELESSFPEGVSWSIPYDTTSFVTASIELVKHTFVEAFVLVLIVVYLFLGSIRATLIPLIAIPVSIVGTFAGLLAMGFSVNMLTLFGMVLAIGIVVDDAIVVVEAVERIMHDEHLPPRDAARKAMKGIGGAIVGVTAVICAVFVPIAFLGGVTGTLYKQFAITITISTLLSAITALTLTPALCSLILKPGVHKPKPIEMFDRAFDRLTGAYVGAVGGILKRAFRFLIIYGAIIGGVVYLFGHIPAGFVPEEDKGTSYVLVNAPPGTSRERTMEIAAKVENYLLEKEPSVQQVVTVGGFSFFYRYSNQALLFVTYKDWGERKDPDQHVFKILQRINRAFFGIVEAQVFAVNEPAIAGMGQVAGFDYRMLSFDGDRDKLNKAAADVIAGAAEEPRLAGVRNVSAPDVRSLFLDVNRNKAKAMGVPLSDMYDTVGALLGSSFVNQFFRFGANLKVKIMAEDAFRSDPAYLNRFYVRNAGGAMVPLDSLMKTEWQQTPIALARYNGYPSARLNGGAAPGRSSGEALTAMEDISAQKLPQGVSFQWTGEALQQKLSSGQQGLIFGLSFIFVFLFLAALYESFSLPVAVFLIVPIGVLGALVALMLRGTPNDVFFQISLITLVGLAGKNGILIVEFAKQRYEEGLSVVDAALESARLRLRPIVMTSLAFIIGLLPLVKASGAGAATQHSVGTGIMGGMIAATLIGVFFTPLFYVIVMNWFTRGRKEAATSPPPGAAPAGAPHDRVKQ